MTTTISALAFSTLALFPAGASRLEDSLTRVKLPSGLEVFIKEDHARKVAALQLWVMVGSADETDAERGISHLIEHMAFKGTQRRGVGQIAAEVEGLGGDMNAYTSWDETAFHITVPSNATAQGLDILLDAVMQPSLDRGELAKEKEVVIEEILEGEERPSSKASKLLYDNAYVKGPYKYPVIGSREAVEKFTRDDIIAFRKKWYLPENMFLLVVGDVEKAKVIKEVERLTTDLRPSGFFRPPRSEEPPQKDIRSSLVRDKNAKETRVHIAYHIPSAMSYYVNALDLASDILGGRDNSRLPRVLKKDKGIVNSIAAYSLTPKHPGLMVVSATLDAKNLEEATRTVMEQVALLSKEPPSDEELRQAKVHIESQQIYARDTVQGVAKSLGNAVSDLGDPYYEEKYLSMNAGVTPEEVSSVVRRYMYVPNVTISALVPNGDAPDLRAETLRDIVSSFPSTVRARSASESEQQEVLVETLPNGIRVVLVADDSNPVVAFRIAHEGGKRFETPGTEGIMNFISRMLDKGTSKLTEEGIAEIVDGMGGRLHGFSGYDSFGMYASFFSRFALDGLKLLAEIHSDVAFPKEKLEKERKLIVNRIETEPDRPVTYALNILASEMFRNHPYGFDKEGTISSVSKMTRRDLQKTYQRFSVPSNTVIAGVGSMNLGKTMDRIRDLFGRLPAKKLESPKVPQEESIREERQKVVKIPRAKAHIAVGFHGTTLSDPDRYPLDVINNILAGQGGRLFVELRDKESLAYTVTSLVRPGLDRGFFELYIACETSKSDRALSGLFQEIDRIRQCPVSDEELKRAISNLTGNHLIDLQSTSSRAEDKALHTLYGLGHDFEAQYLKKISEVTVQQVLEAARKYLDPARCAIVKILPEEEEQK